MVVLLRQGGQQQLCEVQRTNKQPIKIPVARRTYLYQLQYYHCAPKACASRCLDRLTGSGYQKIGCLRPTFEDYLRGKRRLVCTVYSTKSCLTRHRYRRITPLSRSIRVLVRGPLSHPKKVRLGIAELQQRFKTWKSARYLAFGRLCHRHRKTPTTVQYRFISRFSASTFGKIRMIN